MTRTPADVMEELIAATEYYEEYSDYGSMPHEQERLEAELVAFGAASVPVLIDAVEEEKRGFRWAVRALEQLGPTAIDASDALARRAGHDANAAWALFRVDQARALALGLHALEGTRRALLDEIARRDPVQASRLLAQLLEHDDPDVVLFALGGTKEFSNVIDRLAYLGSSYVPVDLIRAHARSSDAAIRARGLRVLAILHSPEDAPGMIAAHGDDPPTLEMIRWIGSLPDSDRLIDFERLGTREWHEILRAFSITRRRRCAGLSTPFDRVRDLIASGLRAPFHGSTREEAIVTATRLVGELGRVDFARDIADAIDNVDSADRIVPTLAILGAKAMRAIEDAIDASTEADRRRRLEWLDDAVRRWVPPREMTVAGGDDRFLAGKLDGRVDSAVEAYADALLVEPRLAYAAAQIAWIERGFGTPITGHRVAWLRELGVDDAILDELVVPVPPLIERTVGTDDDAVAFDESAIGAGLPSAAMPYLAARSSVDAERCRREATAHVERIRRACRDRRS